MNKIYLADCIYKENNQDYHKICFYYKGKYYDLITLNNYEPYNGKFGIVSATILNEKLLNEQVAFSLERRKNDLLGRLKIQANLEYLSTSETTMFSNEHFVDIVLYKVAQIIYGDDKHYYLEDIDDYKLGIMVDDDIFDVQSRNRVKKLNEELILGENYLKCVKAVTEGVLDVNEYLTLAFIANEIIQGKKVSKGKIIVMGKVRGNSNN